MQPFELPLVNLLGRLELLQQRYSVIVDAKLYTFALGLEIAKKMI